MLPTAPTGTASTNRETPMRIAPFTAAAVAAALALGLGGVALAEGTSEPDASGSSTAVADDFAAFDECLREQGVELPPLPDLPTEGEEPTEEELAELDALESEAVEIPDEAWDACEAQLPEDADLGEFDEEAFAEFDQCMADAGFSEEEIEGDGEAEPSEEEIAGFEAELDAAFEQCEELLPDDAIFEGCDDDGAGHEDEGDLDEGESDEGESDDS
jgi:hypothetical protein